MKSLTSEQKQIILERLALVGAYLDRLLAEQQLPEVDDHRRGDWDGQLSAMPPRNRNVKRLTRHRL